MHRVEIRPNWNAFYLDHNSLGDTHADIQNVIQTDADLANTIKDAPAPYAGPWTNKCN